MTAPDGVDETRRLMLSAIATVDGGIADESPRVNATPELASDDGGVPPIGRTDAPPSAEPRVDGVRNRPTTAAVAITTITSAAAMAAGATHWPCAAANARARANTCSAAARQSGPAGVGSFDFAAGAAGAGVGFCSGSGDAALTRS